MQQDVGDRQSLAVWNLESTPLRHGDAPEAATHGHGGAFDLDVLRLVVHWF